MNNRNLFQKSTPDQIRERFDHEVERFSDLDTGQLATIDAPLVLELIASAAIATSPKIERSLDIGCGAGNYSLKLAQGYSQTFACHLIDLSQPMLERAEERLRAKGITDVKTFNRDIREVSLEAEAYDVVLAAAVFHHLREASEWEAVFSKIYRCLRPGGSVWISDLVTHDHAAIQQLMWERYGDYLESVNGPDYRSDVFAYIDIEDSPRSVSFQLDMLKQVGFSQVEILHKNSCFAAFGAIK